MTVTTTTLTSGQDLVERASSLTERFAGRAAEHDREASFPFENFDDLRDAGLLNVTVPVEFGGAGAGLSTVCRITREIARGDASTALVLNMHYMRHANIARAGRWPAAVHERICRESIAGIALINSLRVEPELGTPARGGLPATSATRAGDRWRLRGHKIYTTGSPILRYYLVWARTDADDDLVGNFLVPADTPGCRIVETWDHIGMRATGSHDVIFEDAEIPLEYAVDVRPIAAPPPADPLEGTWNGLGIAALYNGVAVAARDWLVRYLNGRTPTNLGAPLATLPRMQSAVGEIEALLYANERLIYSYAAEVDAGDSGTAGQAPLIKYLATNNAIRAVDVALALIGNPALSRHNPLERYHRDILCSRIHTPQDDTVVLNAGRAALANGTTT